MGEDPREIGEMWTCSAVSALKSVIGECGECLGFDLFDDCARGSRIFELPPLNWLSQIICVMSYSYEPVFVTMPH